MEHPQILIKVKDFGTMKAELYPEYAPLTVANFLSLCENHFFDGLIFHRVIPGFMIQGGGYTADMEERRAKTVKGEFAANGCRTNTLKHKRGVLSMARTNVPDSASSQFFVMHEDAPHLDGQYAAFGRVVEGDEVIDKIAAVKTGNYGYYMQDVPRVPVEIETITVL
ncbi:MAG: peptidylprolyl isomerase [Clostridia bacterium]|nr:peptidylprolyl isomerase [Clostridia bacterium]MDD7701121.1 peptidylprolyl isomerase [Eubacteriales bacterium]MDY2827637.1 peptidylprolyl isomerase [Eubacteriales bacterium]